MALKGDTSNLLLADIFQTLAQNGQSGQLTLRGAELERRILFAPHGVTPNDSTGYRAPRLGHLLAAAGKVSQADIDAILQEIDREGPNPHSAIALLVILDEKGLLALDEGVRVLRTEVLEDLYDLFLVEDEMEFEFEDDDIPSEAIPRECYFRVEEVVMEAARRLDDVTRMQGVVDRSEYYVMTQTAAETDAVAALLDGSNTIVDVSERLAQSRFDVARWVYGLASDSKIRPASTDELIRSARRLDPATHRLKVTQICRRALRNLHDDDSRLDEIGDMLIRANSAQTAIMVLLKRVTVLLEQGNDETAYSQIVRARDLDPNHPGVLKTLAEMHKARGEKAEEAKVLTTLAERCASEERFDEAVEYASRVAEVFPDSPLLDSSFVIYCQKAERHQHGAEVLSQAAGKRDNPTRAVLLYNAILMLDPSRADVKKMIARHQRGRKRGRVYALAGVLLLLPVIGYAVVATLDRVEQARLLGHIESAEKALDAEEPQIALKQLQEMMTADLSADLQSRFDLLKTRVDAALGDLAEAEQAQREQTTRDALTEIQVAIENRHYADAARRLVESLEEASDDETRDRVRAKLPILVMQVDDDWNKLRRLADQFDTPDTDEELLTARARYSEPFSGDRHLAWQDFAARIDALDFDEPSAQTRGELQASIARVLEVFDRVRPQLVDVDSRISRNEALDVLSDDYQEILDAEKRGDFEAAAAGYSRLLRGYGEGTLRSFLEEKLAETTRIREALAEVTGLAERGDHKGAYDRAHELAAETTSYDLLDVVGVPIHIRSVPPSAQISDATRSLGVTPLFYYARRDGAELRASATGFVTTTFRLSSEDEPNLLVGLQRESLFHADLETRVEARPAAADGQLFVGGRDGALYRVGIEDDQPVEETRTESLHGISFPPIVIDDLVVFTVGEGDVFGVDRATMRPRWSRAIGAAPVGSPTLAGDRVMLVARDGRIIEVNTRDGEPRVIATLDGTPSTGPVVIGSTVAVGTTDGRVVAFTRPDGSRVFSTPQRSQPVSGLTADRRFIAADDSGRVFALDASSGAEVWSVESGASLAAPPRADDGLVVVSVGRSTLVLDTDDGAERMRVDARDWVASTPVLSGGRLYVGDRTGTLRVFDFQTQELLFEHRVDSALRASPLILRQGVVLISESGRITLIGT